MDAYYEYFETYGMKPMKFEILDRVDFVNHCFTTKPGGVSTGYCESFNVSLTRDNNPEAVYENLRRLAEYMDADYNKLTKAYQVHGCDVAVVREDNCGIKAPDGFDGTKADALVTNVPGVLLVTSHGDCLPVYIVDTKKRAIGMVHSGWRGTALGIAGCTVKKMIDEYGSDAKDIVACIGPGICEKCFEVDREVVDEFEKAFPGLDNSDGKYWYYDENAEKFHVNLAEFVVLTFKNAGVPENNIEKSGICTCCEESRELLFSHRRDKGKCGIMAAAMMIK